MCVGAGLVAGLPRSTQERVPGRSAPIHNATMALTERQPSIVVCAQPHYSTTRPLHRITRSRTDHTGSRPDVHRITPDHVRITYGSRPDHDRPGPHRTEAEERREHQRHGAAGRIRPPLPASASWDALRFLSQRSMRRSTARATRRPRARPGQPRTTGAWSCARCSRVASRPSVVAILGRPCRLGRTGSWLGLGHHLHRL